VPLYIVRRFAKLRKGSKSFFISVHPSVRPHWNTRLRLDYFPQIWWWIILDYVSRNFIFINIWQKTDNFRTYRL
jgi:hypothetical protein